MRERQRQTATKPTYYIRGIEITAISGLGRFGGGGGLVSDFDHQNHVVHLGLGRASWQGAQGHCPHHFDGLSARLGAPVSSRSPRSRAHRGHRAGFFGVGRACRPGPASAASRSLQKIVGAIVGAASRTGREHLQGSSPPRSTLPLPSTTNPILGVLGRCSRRFESGRGYCCAWCRLREIPDIVVTGSRSGK